VAEVVWMANVLIDFTASISKIPNRSCLTRAYILYFSTIAHNQPSFLNAFSVSCVGDVIHVFPCVL